MEMPRKLQKTPIFLPQCSHYEYNHKGNLGFKYTLGENIQVNSMKYREIRSRRSEVPRPITRSLPKSHKSSADDTFKAKLSRSMNQREVYVLRNGATVKNKSKLPGFYYSFEIIDSNDRFKHILEMKKFFTRCQQVFHTATPFKFTFSSQGKVLHCLHEVPHESKIIFVSHTYEFQGANEDKPCEDLIAFKRSPCYKSNSIEKTTDFSVIDKIQSQFRIAPQKYQLEKQVPHAKTPIPCIQSPTKERKSVRIKNLKDTLGIVSYNIDKTFSTLFSQGIEQLMAKHKFSEAELHNLYGKFKLMVLLSCGTDPGHDISTGITKNSFVGYHAKTEEIAFVLGRIFDIFDADGGGTVSWEEYLKAMDVIWHGDSIAKLEMFFNVYDLDGNGLLSFYEIQELCKLQLEMEKDDPMIEDLSHSFASLIFDLTKTQYSEQITSSKIKEIIMAQEDKELIEMFCSFNCLKSQFS